MALGGLSYIWAGLAGPFYVLAKGFPLRALAMVPITLLLVALGFVLLGFLMSFMHSNYAKILSPFFITVIILTIQGRIGVQLVHHGLLRAGWREGYY